VLWVTDSAIGEIAPAATLVQVGPARLIRVVNKIDLTGLPPGRSAGSEGHSEVRVSARTGAGIEALAALVQEKVGFRAPETAFTARRRHLLALDRAVDALDRAIGFGAGEEELMAEELRLAHLALGEIVGEMTPDDLLGEIFSSFCIGK
jgi:tRNA modification GTPase